MTRYYWTLLVFVVCVATFTGCRRGSGSAQRTPVSPQREQDLLQVQKPEALVENTKPKDRKGKFWLENVYALEDELKNADKSKRTKRVGDIMSKQEALEKDKDNANVMQKLQGDAMQIEGEHEFTVFAKLALKFLDQKKTHPSEYSQDEFKKYLRRSEVVVRRLYLDRIASDISVENVDAVKLLEQFTFVAEVDMNLPRDYIIAYGEASSGGMGMGMGMGMGGMMGGGGGGAKDKGTMAWFNDEKAIAVQRLQSASIKQQIKKQELELLRRAFIGYAAPLMLRPPDQRETDILRRGLGYNDFDAVIRAMQYGNSADVFDKLESSVAPMFKTPPDARDADKFKKHLRDKAPLSLFVSLEGRTLAVNMDVNLRNPNDIVACQTTPETISKDNKTFPVGNVAIFASGAVATVPSAAVLRFAPPPPPQNNMGGMPR